MNYETAKKLNLLTSDFYKRCASSFSETRTDPWEGWYKCAQIINHEFHDKNVLTLLDMGCGNMRFEKFLSEELRLPLDIWAIDNCPELIDLSINADFKQIDIVDALLDNNLSSELEVIPACDLVCCFGLFHHIPGMHLRESMMSTMIEHTRSGGFIVCTFWQFAHSEKLLRKAIDTTAAVISARPELELETGDHLLGWQDVADVYRYCHSFTDAELDKIMHCTNNTTELVSRFCSDGKTHDLNTYVILRKL